MPLAQVRGELGIDGMDEQTAHNVRDKSRMKSVLRAAGVPCARHQLVTRTEEATAFLAEVGLPLVAKPPSGAGAQATYRLDTEQDFASWLRSAQADPAEIWLLEEYLTGREHSLDSATRRRPDPVVVDLGLRTGPAGRAAEPLDPVDVVLPRELGGAEYEAIRDVGPAALRALGIETAFSHMEWFERPDGSVAVSEVGARPPGAQISSMIGFAYDFDFHRAWADLVINSTFTAGRAGLRGRHGLPARPGPRPGAGRARR